MEYSISGGEQPTKIPTSAVIIASEAPGSLQTHKPFIEANGRRLLSIAVDSMLGAGVSDIIVVTGFNAKETSSYARSLGARAVENLNYEYTEPIDSIKLGLEALEPKGAFFVVSCDTPLVSSATLMDLKDTLQGTDAQAAIPSYEGKASQPPIFSAECDEGIQSFAGTGGLSEYIESLYMTATLQVADPAGFIAADSPQGLESLREYAFANLGISRGEALRIAQISGASDETISHMQKVERKSADIAVRLIAEDVPIDICMLSSMCLLYNIADGAQAAKDAGYSAVHKAIGTIGTNASNEAMLANLAIKLVNGQADGGEQETIKSFVKFLSGKRKKQ